MRKSDRHKMILDIVGFRQIGSQADLAKMLRKNGFSVTQASVSRDLDELGVVKVNGKYTRSSDVNAENPFGITQLETAGDSLIVIRCPPGLASAVAVQIDAANLDGIVGTIAGDDTIFIAVDGKDEQKRVVASVIKLIRKKDD